MKTEKQHFVPKAYLKHFCAEKELKTFQTKFLDFKKKWTKPLLKHINSICYIENFYNLSKEFASKNSVKPDHVERNAFWYERGFLDELLRKIRLGTINEEDYEKIPEFYLSMISRNPAFKSGFDPKNIEGLINDTFSLIKKDSKSLEDIKKLAQLQSDEELTKWLSKIKSKLLAEQTQEKMYTSSVYRQHHGHSESYNEVLNKIRGYKIMIGIIHDENQFFLTSDSPGFTFANDGKIYSLKFKEDSFHYMPLSSKVVVALLHPIMAFQYPKFSVTEISNTDIDFINQGTMSTALKYVYCENESFLLRKVQEINSK